MKGVLCALRVQNQQSHFRWHLGLCWKYEQQKDCAEIFVLRGHTIKAPEGHTGFIPDFYLSNLHGEPTKKTKGDRKPSPDKTPAQQEAEKAAFLLMFYPKLIRGSRADFLFLNQVHGVPPTYNRKYRNDIQSKWLMNAKDGCFECSIDGPDHY